MVTMDLVINNTSYINDSIVACDSVEWNGNVYTTKWNICRYAYNNKWL